MRDGWHHALAQPREQARREGRRHGAACRRPTVIARTPNLTVVAVVKPYLAGAAYMELDAFGRALREPGRVSAAYVLMDRSERDALSREVKEIPMIAGVSFLDNASASMRKMLNEGSGFFAYMFVVFSCLMAGGVAYSAARVTFAEQERDLATLRVLGFSRREVSYVLLAEIGALLLIALPRRRHPRRGAVALADGAVSDRAVHLSVYHGVRRLMAAPHCSSPPPSSARRWRCDAAWTGWISSVCSSRENKNGERRASAALAPGARVLDRGGSRGRHRDRAVDAA